MKGGGDVGLIHKASTQHENGPMRQHVLCECDGHMQEYAPRLSALGMVHVCLGGCPSSRVEDRVKRSNVRLKMITSILPIFTGLPYVFDIHVCKS
jgi:hypothetical protein